MPRKKRLNVLIACEISQVEMNAFRKRGCNAYSCDVQLLRGTGDIRYHIPGDATPLLRGERWFYTQDAFLHHVPKWDLIIAHPPCTYLCRASAVQMVKNGVVDPDRYKKMLEARQFFYECLNAHADYLAVENPQPMARAELPPPDFFIDPTWFGAKYTKKTLYWTRNLPPLMANVINPSAKSLVRCSRGKYRSRSFKEVAEAMATQWIDYINKDKKQK